MIHNIFQWTLPVVLVLFEALMRTAIKIDVSDFIGPALAGASATMIAPLTKAISVEETTESGEKVKVMRPFDEGFSHLCLMFLLLIILAWLASIFFAASSSASASTATSTVSAPTLFGWRIHSVIGYAVYGFCVVVLAFRERTK